MARLHASSESEEELPELSTLFGVARTRQNKLESKHHTERKAHGATDRLLAVPLGTKHSAISTSVLESPRSFSKASYGDKQAKIQKPLGLAHVNSLLLPKVIPSTRSPTKAQSTSLDNGKSTNYRNTPKRNAAQKIDFKAFAAELQNTVESTDEDASFDDLSDFIVNDSASDEELKRPKSIRRDTKKSPKKTQENRAYGRDINTENLHNHLQQPPTFIDLTSPDKTSGTATSKQIRHDSTKHNLQEAFLDDTDASLKFSPPSSKPLRKNSDSVRFATPPTSPSKPRLPSPTKSIRIPPSPHRPSLDSFWSQEVINDWNDQYSPRKTPKPRRLFSVTEDDEQDLSPSSSPRKSPIRSPTKKDKQALERKKAFDAEKHDLATKFLQELDNTVADGQVAALTAPTGGVRIIWSKKLNSTAGRANWKREAIRTKTSEGVVTATTYRHQASIELAEKVIDDEDRLLNVLAHEYCHLATFMLSKITRPPHGAAFKSWAQRVSLAFTSRNILVTTKHSYTIYYKYIWACSTCGVEFKRHSKSIDPERHTCGSCKGRLVQVQPAPRGGKGGGKGAGVSGYQAYVKENYGRVKEENQGLGMAQLMVVLGRNYREEKARREKERGGDGLLEGERGKEEGEENERSEGRAWIEEGLNSVARKLDFMSLRDDGHS